MIDVYIIEISNIPFEIEYCFQTLSKEEQQKAMAFYHTKDRASFIYRRYKLREILGQYLNINISDISYEYNNYGKPSLLEFKDVYFNTSHSQGLYAVAINRSCSLGIDIEKIQPGFDLPAMAKEIMDSCEFNNFNQVDKSNIENVFFNTWALKESIIKCMGLGFSFDAKKCMISYEPKTYTDFKLMNLKDHYTIANDYRIMNINTRNEQYYSYLSYKSQSDININIQYQ